MIRNDYLKKHESTLRKNRIFLIDQIKKDILIISDNPSLFNNELCSLSTKKEIYTRFKGYKKYFTDFLPITFCASSSKDTLIYEKSPVSYAHYDLVIGALRSQKKSFGPIKIGMDANTLLGLGEILEDKKNNDFNLYIIHPNAVKSTYMKKSIKTEKIFLQGGDFDMIKLVITKGKIRLIKLGSFVPSGMENGMDVSSYLDFE